MMIIINNINDEKIILYRSLRKTPESHTREKVFIAEGDIAVEKLLESQIEISSIFCTEDHFDKNSELINKRVNPERQYIASKALMDQVVGFRLHKGIMAIAKQPLNRELSELSSPIVILNGIINSENVGSIIRNCSGFGISSMIVDKQTSSPYLRRAVRCSMGAIYYMNIHFTDDLHNSIEDLRSGDHGIFAAENTENSCDINDFIFPDKYVLIFGSEGNGIEQPILSLTDQVIKIPISEKIQSLNVAASSAIFFYHSQRLKLK